MEGNNARLFDNPLQLVNGQQNTAHVQLQIFHEIPHLCRPNYYVSTTS